MSEAVKSSGSLRRAAVLSDKKKQRPKWTVKGTLGLVAFTALVIYSIVPIALCTPLYSEIVLHPLGAFPPDYARADETAGCRHQDIFFSNTNGDKLHALYWKLPGTSKVIVYHHGNAGNVSYRAAASKALMAMKTSVFVYDYRGFGKSSGKATLQGVLDDGLAAYDCVRDQLHYAPADIVNYGESLGAGPACEVAGKRPSGGLFLQSGIPSLSAVGREHFFFLRPYPDWLMPSPLMDNMIAVRSIHVPVAIVHGGKDETIPAHLAQKVYANANQPKQFFLLKDSNHNAVDSGDDLRTYLSAVGWILSAHTTGGGAADRISGKI